MRNIGKVKSRPQQLQKRFSARLHLCSYLIFAGIDRLQPIDLELVGGYTQRETPDPFPNSEAKALGPMVVRKRESRSLPTFMEARWLPQRAFFFACIAANIPIPRRTFLFTVISTSGCKQAYLCDSSAAPQ